MALKIVGNKFLSSVMWGEGISLLIIFYWHQESKHPKVVQENLEYDYQKTAGSKGSQKIA